MGKSLEISAPKIIQDLFQPLRVTVKVKCNFFL